ncbi:MAG: 4Fe-4S dicluster domain-containing protein [Desulforudis sp.]|nr:MAG: 4Fe-4S dicluster domain-containing protein [Desulforudis sp.]
MALVMFDEERCKGCSLCVEFCPKEIIVLNKRINAMGFHPATVTDLEKCIGCSRCALICPDVVIRVERDCPQENVTGETEVPNVCPGH